MYRAGSTLSSSQAYKLHPSTSPEQQQDAAVASQGSGGQAETSIVARITVATAAYVPQVCDIVMLSRLHPLVCSVEEGCFLGLVAFPCSRCGRTGMTSLRSGRVPLEIVACGSQVSTSVIIAATDL